MAKNPHKVLQCLCIYKPFQHTKKKKKIRFQSLKHNKRLLLVVKNVFALVDFILLNE